MKGENYDSSTLDTCAGNERRSRKERKNSPKARRKSEEYNIIETDNGKF